MFNAIPYTQQFQKIPKDCNLATQGVILNTTQLSSMISISSDKIEELSQINILCKQYYL